MRAVIAATAFVVLLAPPAVADPDPDLSVPQDELDAALTCPDAFDDAGREPVLLVHGTYTNPEENWGWNYLAALPAEGWDVCTVQLPDRSLGDIQVAAEYVVHAIREIASRSGEQVDVMGHSQGVLQPRWALRWWPSTRPLVDDLVMFAGPNHGTVVADRFCTTPCPAAVAQMTTTSDFIRLLNSDDESPGAVSYTSLYSLNDELVQPSTPTPTAAVEGAVNVLLQDLCPGRPVTHVSIVGDAVAYSLAIDALTTPGPADVARFDPAVCAESSFPGVDPLAFAGPDALQAFLDQSFPPLGGEPDPAGYTSGSDPTPAPTTGADDGAPVPSRADGAGDGLPATGGGLAAAGLLALAVSRGSRGRRAGRAG